MWEEIVNKALLGSEKASLTSADLPGDIAAEFHVEESHEKEDAFLRIAALAYQFRQSGALPIKANDATLKEAAPESRPYCSEKANAILKTLMEEELLALLGFCLGLCISKQQLAYPEVIPSLLNVAERRKEFRHVILDVVGERGKWLCSLNPDWRFSSLDTDVEKVWSDGSAEERRELLRHLRHVDPEQGRRLLESSWATEGANEKLSFLEILKTNISAADLPWLESLKEKSQKVNAAIVDVLKLIPSSDIVQEYQRVLAACMSLKSGKALLGMINKTETVINETFAFPDSIFKTGIEKLSSSKSISDAKHIIAQLMMAVPPSFLAEHVQRNPEEMIELFQKDKQTAFFLPAIALAAVRFKDKLWITKILDKADKDVVSSSIATLLSGLEGNDRDRYALKYFDEQPAEIIQLMMTNDTEWSLDLAKVILKYTAREVYQYNKHFYRQAIAFTPAGIVNYLDSFTPPEEQKKVYWQTQRDELARLLTLKQQTLESFHA
jgi:hypothetical protein